MIHYTMTETPKPTEFVYRNIELYKSESFGSGSYGGVCKAKCDGLLCAAKIMHPTLFDFRDPGTATYLSKFQEECHLLSLARHPNIVLYLGTFTDPDTRLPVLLMELCDESLTAFLERSPGPLSYHIQVDICHDIALALVYLHFNGLIHRDLTGNNVLMIAGPRAKITDFGMSKLANVNPHLSAFTLCPGNVLYMSPGALSEAKSYTNKLDSFSFGVIVIQILTRLFPNPTDRFRHIQVEGVSEEVLLVVPETERRASHLQMIPDTHSLKPLAIQCLKKEEVERPSALELSDKLSELKQCSQYRESKEGAGCNQCKKHQEKIHELERVMRKKDQWLQKKDMELEVKKRAHQAAVQVNAREHKVAMERVVASRDLAFKELHASEQLVSEFEQSLQQRGRTITDLQQTISAHERKIQQLEQQDTASRDTPHQEIIRTPQTTAAAGGGKDISKMKWRKGKNAPEAMGRGAAVVHGNTTYFRPANSVKVYSYQSIQGDEQWCQLPNNPNESCGLVVIDGLLTSIGGYNRYYTNILLSLKGEGEKMKWSEVFPPMPTSRSHVVCVTIGETLVVAGGCGVLGNWLDTVEVFNTNSTKQWTTVSPLPQKCYALSATVCEDKLYLAGSEGSSKSVYTCCLPDLLKPTVLKLSTPHNVWREISNVPVFRSTLVSFGGDLLAIGGKDDSNQPTPTVYKYDSLIDSWTVASQMINKRYSCFAVSLPKSRLIVVGGITIGFSSPIDSIEIGEI